MKNTKTKDIAGMKLIREYHTGAKDYKDPDTNEVVHVPAPTTTEVNNELKIPPVEIEDGED